MKTHLSLPLRSADSIADPSANSAGTETREGLHFFVLGADQHPEAMEVLKRRSRMEGIRLLWPVRMKRARGVDRTAVDARESEWIRMQVEAVDVVLVLGKRREARVYDQVAKAAAEFGKLTVNWPNSRFPSLDGLFEFVASYCRTYGAPAAQALPPVKKRRRSFKGRVAHKA